MYSIEVHEKDGSRARVRSTYLQL